MKKENLNESGRSMVEMLGVLAIIGVLSVMGIAGYRAAMTRHRANELLNEASKRAVVVAAQLSLQGLPTANLNEFTEYQFSGGEFSRNEITPSDDTFQIQINGVDESVCELMSGIADDNAMIKAFAPTTCSGSNNTVQLTYNNDLGTGAAGSGDLNCTEGQEVYNNKCVAVCPEGISRARDGSCSICDNGKVYLSYNSDPCQVSVSGCTSNDDCVQGEEYCNLSGNNCEYPATGECTPIGESDEAIITSLGKRVRVKSTYMSWWSADNWCKANNMHLMDVSEFGCYQNGTSTLVTANTGYYDGCCAQGASCSYSETWFNEDEKGDYSTILYELEQAFGNEQYFWTSSANGSCSAFRVTLDSAYVLPNDRNATGDDHFYALCVGD